MSEHKFGKLKLSVEGTSNGSGFDILYDFDKGSDFVEFRTKPGAFYFIQPWMQFPSKEYSDECKLVSIELVRRFNEFPVLQERNKVLQSTVEELIAQRDRLRENAGE